MEAVSLFTLYQPVNSSTYWKALGKQILNETPTLCVSGAVASRVFLEYLHVFTCKEQGLT